MGLQPQVKYDYLWFIAIIVPAYIAEYKPKRTIKMAAKTSRLLLFYF
jgi:hypothetical protein